MRFRVDSHYDEVQLRIGNQLYELSQEEAENLIQYLKIRIEPVIL